MTRVPGRQDIASIVARLERDVASLMGSTRLTYSSLDDGAVQVVAGGSLRGVIGQQADGTVAVNIVNGPPPPTPTTPTVEGVLGGIRVTWDGGFTDDAILPLDFSRIEIHVSTVTGFSPSDTTLATTIETPQGGLVGIPTDDYAERFVVLRARNTSGTAGPASAQAAGTPRQVEEPDLSALIELGGTLADASVTTAKLAANAVTVAKIADGAIEAGKLAANAVTASALNAGAVTTAKLADDAVTAAQIATGAVGSTELSAGAVTAGKVAADAIQAGQIAAGAIAANDISAGAVTAGKLAAGAVQAGNIAALAIAAGDIAAGAITTGKLAALAVDASKIAALAITTDKLAALAVDADKIAANAITADKINANAVTAAKIAANQINATHITAGTVSALLVAGDTITTQPTPVNSTSRVVIDQAGVRLISRDGAGVDTTKVNLSTATGAGTFTGTITGADITGSSFEAVGALVYVSGSGSTIRYGQNRVELDENGLHIYYRLYLNNFTQQRDFTYSRFDINGAEVADLVTAGSGARVQIRNQNDATMSSLGTVHWHPLDQNLNNIPGFMELRPWELTDNTGTLVYDENGWPITYSSLVIYPPNNTTSGAVDDSFHVEIVPYVQGAPVGGLSNPRHGLYVRKGGVLVADEIQGHLRIPMGSDVSLASTGHSFQIGDSTSINLRIDNNEIQAVNNGATSTLYLNAEGGAIRVGGFVQDQTDPGWHSIGGTGEPAFQNSWTNYATSTWERGSFKKFATGDVALGGVVMNPTGTAATTIFTLPTGFRPSIRHMFLVVTNGGMARIDVFASGAVQVANYFSGGTAAWVSLAGIRFPLD